MGGWFSGDSPSSSVKKRTHRQCLLSYEFAIALFILLLSCVVCVSGWTLQFCILWGIDQVANSIICHAMY